MAAHRRRGLRAGARPDRPADALGSPIAFLSPPRAPAELGRHPRPRRGAGQEWGHLQLSLRPRTLHLELVQKLGRARRSSPNRPCRSNAQGTAKGDVSLLRSLAPRGRIDEIAVEFHNAGGVLFGVKEYVPPSCATLSATDRPEVRIPSRRGERPRPGSHVRDEGPDGGLQEVTRRFDMLHVCPPRPRPIFVRRARSPAMPAGSTSTIGRCSTRGLRMSSRSATFVPRRTPRPPRAASRLRSWRRMSSPS